MFNKISCDVEHHSDLKKGKMGKKLTVVGIFDGGDLEENGDFKVEGESEQALIIFGMFD